MGPGVVIVCNIVIVLCTLLLFKIYTELKESLNPTPFGHNFFVAAWINIIKFIILIPILGEVVEEEHPYKFSNIANR